VTPFCPHFGTLRRAGRSSTGKRALSPWKHDLVVEALGRQSLIATFIRIDAMPRPAADHPARTDGTHEVLKVGFAAAGSHDIIPAIAADLEPGLSGALDAAWALAAH